jgi:diguanylate cyclase (GGDEF)-like protein
VSLSELSHNEMSKALIELDRALFNHEQWCEALNRNLICGSSPDQRDMDEDAYHKCLFGQWLKGAGSGVLSRHPGFSEIETAHTRMHQAARGLLMASANQEPVRIEDYERFVNSLKQMRLEILTTKHELEDAIYNIDPLTGAASRIAMLTKLREQQALVKRKVQSCCLAMMDVDHFKRVNDTHGHATGDRVLVGLARHVKTQVRPYDLFFRYGGEEFLLCAGNTDLNAGQDMFERLRGEIEGLRFDNGGAPFGITISIGLTMLDPDVTVEQSIELADKALYAAKAAGRNRVLVWNASMT